MTKTIIHEEHHEAFLVWHQAISKGLIDIKGNTLIHVDSHDDFCCPIAALDINKLSDDLEEIENYTYWQLTIANFIVPALYKKIFDKLMWIAPFHKKEPQTKQYSIRTVKEEGKQFVMGSYNPFHSVNFPWYDSVQFSYIKANTEHPVTTATNVVLDIDLDYFSCIEQPLVEINIEITEDEYYRIKDNKYHPLRLSHKISLAKENARFYMRQHSPIIITGSKIKEGEIVKRMESFRDFLDKNKIRPSFINICRSVKSGFTPKDQAVFIEEKLLELLEQLYSLSISFLQPST